jgi:DNA-binding NtrC family response regulator
VVDAPEINLADVLEFEPNRGAISLKGYRMVLFSACALGALRKELIETLGWDRARGLMKRFGHAAGLADGLALAERFPEATGTRHMGLGPALHALEGMARVVGIPEDSVIDLDRGFFHAEGYWENSFEAEQHLDVLGKSEEPVCWNLVGYATGHSSAAAGRPTTVMETECVAMGHERCRYTAGFADEMPDATRRESSDYEPEHLPRLLQDLLQTISQQKRTLRSRERKISRLESDLELGRARSKLIGASKAFNEALDLAALVAPHDTTVLILGESGTGKELLARTLHEQSPRSDAPFIAVNCSALPENLQEAELFGYAKGAFTGATRANPGVFEAASGGTLFLDEVGDLALTAQTKILRALQEGEIKRLGETRTRRVKVRVLTATNRDLERMVREKTFREDLYYRVGVVSVALPPLRARGNDVVLLADHFLRKYANRFGKNLSGMSSEVTRKLLEYVWPGNVRELENVVQRAVIISKSDRIEVDDLPEQVASGLLTAPADQPQLRASSALSTAGAALLEIDDESERIRRALELTGGNRRRAATLLGIGRTTLWRRMKEFDIDSIEDTADS